MTTGYLNTHYNTGPKDEEILDVQGKDGLIGEAETGTTAEGVKCKGRSL
jgi:hypothetical protein